MIMIFSIYNLKFSRFVKDILCNLALENRACVYVHNDMHLLTLHCISAFVQDWPCKRKDGLAEQYYRLLDKYVRYQELVKRCLVPTALKYYIIISYCFVSADVSGL